ncbi:MAG: thioredoxin family protein [Bacilli bacterium]|nr:thioredoxin family protein [Bacilli bacterium]
MQKKKKNAIIIFEERSVLLMKEKKTTIYIISIVLIIVIAFLLINNINNGNNNTLKELSYKQIQEKTEKKDSYVLVISRTTCSHCMEYKPKLKKISSQYKINLFYIDYDKESKNNQKKLFDQFDLDGSTPITIFIKKGNQTNIFDRIEGDVSEKKVIDKLKKLKYIE